MEKPDGVQTAGQADMRDFSSSAVNKTFFARDVSWTSTSTTQYLYLKEQDLTNMHVCIRKNVVHFPLQRLQELRAD